MKKYIKQFCVVVVCFGVLVQQIMPVNAIAASKKNVVKKEYFMVRSLYKRPWNKV